MSNDESRSTIDDPRASLIQRAAGGDRDAQERLLEPLRPALDRFFAGRMRDRDEAESTTQQVFFEVLRQLPAFRGECPFDRWVWRIAANMLVRQYRRKDRTTEIEPDQDFADESQVPSVMTAEWLKAMLAAAKEACTQAELTVMLLYYQTGSFDEVAELADENAATVRSRFLRGRSSLLAYLIRFQPDLVGGIEHVASVAKRLRGVDEGLDEAEFQAFANGSYPSKLHRTACVKIARHLASPI